jgi:hypothetical protein
MRSLAVCGLGQTWVIKCLNIQGHLEYSLVTLNIQALDESTCFRYFLCRALVL